MKEIKVKRRKRVKVIKSATGKIYITNTPPCKNKI